nr:CAMK protein kinase [Kwoniella dejecticola CBS 10117]OBR87323.1 CAMK protein kinase [Kwoniella dejecticola CBS 10117]
MSITQATQDQALSLRLFYSSDPTSTFPLHPWVIHNYPLGNGSWGIVNIGSHLQDPTVQVAIKTIKRVQDAYDYFEWIKLEIQIQKDLDHPNVLKLFDWVIERQGVQNRQGQGEVKGDPVDGKIHIVMELVTGGDLWSYLERYGHLREDEVRWIGWQIIDGLKHLHRRGIVHRDIKPENILLHTSCAYPRILLADFGCSSCRSSITSQSTECGDGDGHEGDQRDLYHTSKADLRGTSEYLSYDILRAFRREEAGRTKVYEGSREEVGRIWWQEEMGADMWATGVTLYFCATHEHPYQHLRDEKLPSLPCGDFDLDLGFILTPDTLSITEMSRHRNRRRRTRTRRSLHQRPEQMSIYDDDDIEMDDSPKPSRRSGGEDEEMEPIDDFPSPRSLDELDFDQYQSEYQPQLRADRRLSMDISGQPQLQDSLNGYPTRTTSDTGSIIHPNRQFNMYRNDKSASSAAKLYVGPSRNRSCTLEPFQRGSDRQATLTRKLSEMSWDEDEKKDEDDAHDAYQYEDGYPYPAEDEDAELHNGRSRDSEIDGIIDRIERFKKISPSQWAESERWSQWSEEGKAFIDELFTLDPRYRTRSKHALKHEWFVNNAEQIEGIYEKVLDKGEVIRWLL